MEWNQAVERGKYKMKDDLANMYQNNCDYLEKILEKTCQSHEKLRKNMEKYEYQMIDLRQQFRGRGRLPMRKGSTTPGKEQEYPMSPQHATKKARIYKTISRRNIGGKPPGSSPDNGIKNARRLITL